MKHLLLVLTLSFVACAPAPPNITPQAKTAWYGTQVIHSLDLLRDMVIDANKTDPPLVSTESTKTIVQWHRSALETVHQTPVGWQNTVSTGLVETLRNLPPAERKVIQPYTTLLLQVLQEVH